MNLSRRSFLKLSSTALASAIIPTFTIACGYTGCTAKYAPMPNRRMKKAIKRDYQRFYRLTVSQQHRYQRYLAK